MSNLQDRADEFKEAFESGAPTYNVPREAIETMHQAALQRGPSVVMPHSTVMQLSRQDH